jgi:hypothetical protein
MTAGEVVGSGSLTRLIAYVSLGMLAAAFGAAVGPTWSRWWALFGTFGLASAEGLDIVYRARARHAQRAQNALAAMRLTRKLGEELSDLEASDAIRATLRQLQSAAGSPNARGPGSQAGTRLSLDRPATIWRLLRSPADAGYRLGEPLPGWVQNVSCCGFGLSHDHRLEPGLILLDFVLDSGQTVQFVGEVLWCEFQRGGGYLSGGKILDAIGPDEPPSR